MELNSLEFYDDFTEKIKREKRIGIGRDGGAARTLIFPFLHLEGCFFCSLFDGFPNGRTMRMSVTGGSDGAFEEEDKEE